MSRLTGDSGVLLSAALRRELVRHVDDCPRCRRTAERVEAAGPWPGTTPRAARRSPAVLPLVEADRAAACAAMLHAPRSRGAGPRFGRDGFPLDPKDRAARRDRLRARAVTTTVVATVVAAPVFALWAAYRGAPDTGEGHGGPSISAGEPGGPSSHDGKGPDRYENAGSARDRPGATGPDGGHGAQGSDVSVAVVGPGRAGPSGRPGAEAGALAVTAESSSGRTTITLTASGAPVTWAASVGASWIGLSQSSGTLAPGRSVTLYVTVDHAREPAGPWRARIALHPTGAVVLVDGYGYRRARPGGGSDAGGAGGHGGGHGGGGHHGGGAGGGTGPGRPGG
ncbi:BACON domain-containing protein, partial [Streptomyces sp. 8L]|uniref:BACON domain-containing protein n=1 Tax=Streptomyces sp. 8L TaxID=2877242 RepID=UPI003F914EC1